MHDIEVLSFFLPFPSLVRGAQFYKTFFFVVVVVVVCLLFPFFFSSLSSVHASRSVSLSLSLSLHFCVFLYVYVCQNLTGIAHDLWLCWHIPNNNNNKDTTSSTERRERNHLERHTTKRGVRAQTKAVSRSTSNNDSKKALSF